MLRAAGRIFARGPLGVRPGEPVRPFRDGVPPPASPAEPVGYPALMLGRYRIVRGKRPPGEPLPAGLRQDTRKHTGHVLRPDADAVARYLADPGDAGWEAFSRGYRALLEERSRAEPERFQAIADAALTGDLWLGCSCPTAKNPDVRRCHTSLALGFLAERFPELEVHWPAEAQG